METPSSMFFRKPSPTSPLNSLPCSTPKSKDTTHHINTTFINTFTRSLLKFTLFSFLLIASCLLILHFKFPPTKKTTTITQQFISKAKCHDGSGPFYIYPLPSRFNLDLLKHCQNLNIYTNMCPHVANNGLGQPLRAEGVDMSSRTTGSWYATHQFIAEMIIHARLENHPCRTWEPSEALLFYVPFYGGLYASSVFREPDHGLRDALAVELVDFVTTRHWRWWERRGGEDHFIALGRTAWDFMRSGDGGADFGANILLNLPAVKNMSVLTVERQPWNGANQNGIPYPSYFHPKTVTEMLTWQGKVRESERPYLFSFVGGKRKGLEKAKVRDEIVKQCGESTKCELVQCGSGASKCHEPMEVLSVMMKSQFCLQAPGDSFTRRSTFDSILAGCIPVFFSPHTAYTQYAWYLPEDKSLYSVYIDEKELATSVNGEKVMKKIEEMLLNISSEKVKRMREVVVALIPRVTYAHPNASDVGFQDAVDVLLQRLSRNVRAKILSSRSAGI